jgi:hypothetical protein
MYKYMFREEVSVEEIPEQHKQETEDRRRDLIGIDS